GPQPVTFYRTTESNDWVAKNFKVQARYTRVIAVYTGDKAPQKVSVVRLDLNAPPGAPQVSEELPVALAVHTREEASKASKGGALGAVLPGHYAGCVIGDRPDTGDEKYVHFKALGAPGEVTIDAPPPSDQNWMVHLQGAHHVILQGFNIAGSN